MGLAYLAMGFLLRHCIYSLDIGKFHEDAWSCASLEYISAGKKCIFSKDIIIIILLLIISYCHYY